MRSAADIGVVRAETLDDVVEITELLAPQRSPAESGLAP